MISIESYRDEGLGEKLRSSVNDVPVMTALRCLCVGELPDSGVVTILTPTKIEVRSSWMSQRDRTIFQGSEADMHMLFLAAGTVDGPSSRRAADRAARDYAGYQTVTSPDGGAAFSLAGMAAGFAGRKHAVNALLAAVEVNVDHVRALAHEIDMDGTMAAVQLHSEGVDFAQAAIQVKTVRDLLNASYGKQATLFGSRANMVNVIDSARNLGLSMQRTMDAFLAALNHGLTMFDVQDIVSFADAKGVSLDEAARSVAARPKPAPVKVRKARHRWSPLRLLDAIAA